MDWPLARIVTGIVVFTGASVYGVVGIIRSDTPPPHNAAVGPALVSKSALLVFVPPSESREQFSDTSLISLSNPPRPFEFDETPPPPEPRRAPSPIKAVHPTLPVSAKSEPRASKSTQAYGPSALLSPPPAQQAPAGVQWRVAATANASSFGLGGHIDNAGTVDGLASGDMRDAFKAHRNFSRLPPDIKTHILTQNISLPKIAPVGDCSGSMTKSSSRNRRSVSNAWVIPRLRMNTATSAVRESEPSPATGRPTEGRMLRITSLKT
jgi:hypothetical protein